MIYQDGYLNKLSKLPLFLIGLIVLTNLYGVLILYSAGGKSLFPWASKQLLYFILFAFVMVYIASIDSNFVYKNAYNFYIFTLILLVLVEVFGTTAMGAKRWVNLGIAKIQPAELSKIALVLMLARYFNSKSYSEIARVKTLIIPGILSLIPMLLIIKQPDLGTGIVLLIIATTIFYAAGVRIYVFLVGILGGLIVAPTLWNKLHNYQKQRIIMFLKPEEDPLGDGYNIIQSKIAIGSGGFFGKGLFQGPQSKLDFLPEHQTDFIFSTLAEELGFFGSIILIILYGLIIYNSTSIALRVKSDFARLTVIGINTIFSCHVIINIAMVSGMLPVVGIPLPFLSYGRTMMGSMMIGFGIIFNLYLNYKSKFNSE